VWTRVIRCRSNAGATDTLYLRLQLIHISTFRASTIGTLGSESEHCGAAGGGGGGTDHPLESSKGVGAMATAFVYKWCEPYDFLFSHRRPRHGSIPFSRDTQCRESGPVKGRSQPPAGLLRALEGGASATLRGICSRRAARSWNRGPEPAGRSPDTGTCAGRFYASSTQFENGGARKRRPN